MGCGEEKVGCAVIQGQARLRAHLSETPYEWEAKASPKRGPPAHPSSRLWPSWQPSALPKDNLHRAKTSWGLSQPPPLSECLGFQFQGGMARA